MKTTRIIPLMAMLVWTTACGGGGDAADTSGAEGGTATTTEAPPAAAPVDPAAAAPAETPPGVTVHEVRMVTTQGGASGTFEPANLTVKKGDVIRFTNDGGTAHNANFNTQQNSGKAGLPPATPFLTAAGQTADVTITMDPGTYNYQCDPHVAMGMIGQVTVQ
jgi:plastocyanin